MQQTVTAKPAQTAGGRDLASEIAGLGTPCDIIGFLKAMAKQRGLSHVCICSMSGQEGDQSSCSLFISSFPANKIGSVEAFDLIRQSPGFKRLRTTTTPFEVANEEWDHDIAGSAGVRHAAALREMDVQQIDFFPVHDADGRRAAVIFLGRRAALPMSVTMELQMIAIHVFNRLTAMGAWKRDSDVILSERETQCLTWTAAGKTSAEIAGILGLSEHTVNHYLNHVTRKLNAVNRTQAVVKAMKRGLIS